MDLKIIIGVVIVVIILYLIWTFFFSSVQMLMSFQSANTLNCISGKQVAQSGLNNYSFSVWTYINDWTGGYGAPKNIISIQSPPLFGANPTTLFQLFLDANRNDLHIYVKHAKVVTSSPLDNTQTSDDVSSYQQSSSQNTNSTCSITNFPVQSWVNISISVYNRAVDVYIDGKLVRTCSLANVASPIDSGSTIYIGGSGSGGNNNKCSGGGELKGFTGYIASVLYNPDIISPQDAWNTYARGYNNSTLGLNNLFQRYKLEFSFLKDNSVIKSFKI
jgi:hypothetical protein